MVIEARRVSKLRQSCRNAVVSTALPRFLLFFSAVVLSRATSVDRHQLIGQSVTRISFMSPMPIPRSRSVSVSVSCSCIRSHIWISDRYPGQCKFSNCLLTIAAGPIVKQLKGTDTERSNGFLVVFLFFFPCFSFIFIWSCGNLSALILSLPPLLLFWLLFWPFSIEFSVSY